MEKKDEKRAYFLETVLVLDLEVVVSLVTVERAVLLVTLVLEVDEVVSWAMAARPPLFAGWADVLATFACLNSKSNWVARFPWPNLNDPEKLSASHW